MSRSTRPTHGTPEHEAEVRVDAARAAGRCCPWLLLHQLLLLLVVVGLLLRLLLLAQQGLLQAAVRAIWGGTRAGTHARWCMQRQQHHHAHHRRPAGSNQQEQQQRHAQARRARTFAGHAGSCRAPPHAIIASTAMSDDVVRKQSN